jgi:hypothetical protein
MARKKDSFARARYLTRFHMRSLRHIAAALATAATIPAALAQEPFDACNVFTPQDAEKALGAAAVGEPVNPKAKRPKVVMHCTYTANKEGKAVSAKAEFRISRSPEESQRVFDEARLVHQTKPMLLSGAEAFWAGKSGVMHARKGRTWVTITVGGAKPSERELADARKLAEILVAKL